MEIMSKSTFPAQPADQAQQESRLGDNRVVAVKGLSKSHEYQLDTTMPKVTKANSRAAGLTPTKSGSGNRRIYRSGTKFPWPSNYSKKRKSTSSPSSRSTTSGSTSATSSSIVASISPHAMSMDLYSLLFFNTYDPLLPNPAPSPEQKHQINMLSSLDIFLKTRLGQDDAICGPIAVEGSDAPTIYEAPFVKFWAVHNLFETGQLTEAFTLLDEWCTLIQSMLRTQQPPLLSLLAVMSFEFHKLGKPEIADRVLNFLTSLAEVYLGKRHPLSVMIWCLRASNIADELALPELALERAIKQLSKVEHRHIALLVEDVKFRYSLVLRHRGKIEESVTMLQSMAEDAERVYGPLSTKTMEPLYTRARAYFDAEKNEQGKEAFEAILNRVGNASGWDNTWLRTGSHGRLAQICKRLGYDLQARNHALFALDESVKLNDEAQQKSVWLARFERDKIL